jgi:hypothetical protein
MSKSRLRRNLSRWADSSDQEARDLQATYSGKDCVRISEAPDREMVRLRGSLRTVSLRPRAGIPALEAELSDGSGVIVVVWLGRRRIAGIDAGRSLQVQGRIGEHEGVRTMFNPRYELIP